MRPDVNKVAPLFLTPDSIPQGISCLLSPHRSGDFAVARVPATNYTTRVIRILSLRLIALALLLSRAMVGA